MQINSKYLMIITSEDERYERNECGLDFFSNNPWEGLLEEIVCGDSFEELYGDGKNEGLFYQLYHVKTGKRIGRGIFEPDSPREEIEEFEKTSNSKEENL